MISTVIFLIADAFTAICWARLLLQWAQLPYAHPLAQFCVFNTNWLIRPLRKLTPSLHYWDTACIVAVIIVYFLTCMMDQLVIQQHWHISMYMMAITLVTSLLLGMKSLCSVLVIGLLLRMLLSFSQPYSLLMTALQRIFMPLTRPFAFLRFGRYDFSGAVLIILLWLCMTIWLPQILNHLHLSILME